MFHHREPNLVVTSKADEFENKAWRYYKDHHGKERAIVASYLATAVNLVGGLVSAKSSPIMSSLMLGAGCMNIGTYGVAGAMIAWGITEKTARLAGRFAGNIIDMFPAKRDDVRSNNDVVTTYDKWPML